MLRIFPQYLSAKCASADIIIVRKVYSPDSGSNEADKGIGGESLADLADGRKTQLNPANINKPTATPDEAYEMSRTFPIHKSSFL